MLRQMSRLQRMNWIHCSNFFNIFCWCFFCFHYRFIFCNWKRRNGKQNEAAISSINAVDKLPINTCILIVSTSLFKIIFYSLYSNIFGQRWLLIFFLQFMTFDWFQWIQKSKFGLCGVASFNIRNSWSNVDKFMVDWAIPFSTATCISWRI